MSENQNTQLAVLPPAALSRNIDPAAWNALTEIYDGASPEKVALVFDYCKARRLDPLKKPVHIVPTYSSRRKCMVETIWPSISETRITAMRTGLFAGQDETKFGAVRKEKIGSIEIEFPEWAQVTVHRLLVAGDPSSKVAFHGPKVYFLEAYASRKGDDDITPNKMWARRTWGQLEKCAEAAALRRAFPEEAGGQFSAEEMHGKAVDDDGLLVVSQQAPAAGSPAGTNPDGSAADPAGVAPVKRAAVPRKAKGASAVPVAAPDGPTIDVDAQPVTNGQPEAEAVPAPAKVEAAPAQAQAPKDEAPAPAPAPSQAPAPTTPPPAAAPTPAPTPAPAPVEQAKAPARSVEKPAEKAKAKEKPEWPKVVVGYLDEVREASVKGNAKYTSVKVARLGGGTTKINGVEVPLSQLGRVIFDPERPELAKFAEIDENNERIEFTIEQQPAASDPTRMNLVVIKAVVADVAM